MRICSYPPISIGACYAAQGTHDCIVLDEAECKLGDFITEGDRLRGIFAALLLKFLLQLSKILSCRTDIIVRPAVSSLMTTLTSDSCGNRVTNAIKSSHPALRLIGFCERRLSSSAPSFKACTSSNMVPASNCPHLYLLSDVLRGTHAPFDFTMASASDKIAANGGDI